MSDPLESYEIERADFARVVAGIRRIQAASPDELQSLAWLLETIREVGLVPIPDAEITYADDSDCLNSSEQGLIQIPREFARWLLLLSEHRPATYLEIGTFNGATASLATAYLQRFNPSFTATTIDVWPAFVFHHELRDLIPLRYVVGKTSFDFATERFDAVFIDGDHSFEWAWADYQNVGRTAKICGLHDVNNAPYRDLAKGGVCGVWELLRRTEAEPGIAFTEIFEHPSRPIMGIGVRHIVLPR